MIQIQAVKKRAFLRQICEGAKKNALPLKEALLTVQSGINSENFKRGRILVSTSGSGQSGSFELGVQGKEWTTDNVFGLVEELIELLETYSPSSYPDTGIQSETDALFTALSTDDSLTTIRRQGSDLTNIGWQNQSGWGAA